MTATTADLDRDEFVAWLRSLASIDDELPRPRGEYVCPIDRWKGNTIGQTSQQLYGAGVLPDWAARFVKRIDNATCWSAPHIIGKNPSPTARICLRLL